MRNKASSRVWVSILLMAYFGTALAQQPVRPPAGFVLIQHAYPEADVLLNNVLIIRGLEQSRLSPVQEIYPENHRIGITSNGSSSMDAEDHSLLFTFREGHRYLVIVHENAEIEIIDLTRLRDGLFSLLSHFRFERVP